MIGDPNRDDDAPPKPPMGFAFWLALAFGLVCVIAGMAVARFGPALFPRH